MCKRASERMNKRESGRMSAREWQSETSLDCEVHFALDFGSIFILNHYALQFAFAPMHHQYTPNVFGGLSCALVANSLSLSVFPSRRRMFCYATLVVCMLNHLLALFHFFFFNFLFALCFPLFEICTQINILCIHNSHFK